MNITTNNDELNFNYNECIKSYDKWGETIYQNICNNEETTVPWGISGYGILIFLVIIGLLFLGLLVTLIKSLFE